MEKNEIKKWVMLILVAVISYWVINNLEMIGSGISRFISVLFPFILGGFLAFILNIPMSKIEKFFLKRVKSKDLKPVIRVVSIVLSLMLLIGIVGIVAFLLIPELVTNIESLINNIPMLMEKVETFVLDLLDRYPDIQKEFAKLFNETADTSAILSDLLNYVISGAINFVSNLVSGIIAIFTAIVFAIYMLSQKEYLIKGFKKLLYAYLNKNVADKIVEIGNLSNSIFSKFIFGQCVEAVILGSIFFVVLSLLKFPYALLISVLTTVTALIPIFGAIMAMIVGAILIAINNPIQALIFIVVFQMIQQIEGNFIYPKVVGKSVGLSPMWTLLAISVGGSLFGIVGMFLGLPIASIIYSLIKKDADQRLKNKDIIRV